MKKLFVFLEEVWKFFKLLIKEWWHFPVGCYKKIIYFLNEKDEIYNIFNKMTSKNHKISVLLGTSLIMISMWGFDKDFFLLDGDSKLLLISSLFFEGVFFIVLNFNLKKKFTKIIIVILLVILAISSYKIKAFIIPFIILLIGWLFMFQLREVVITGVTFLFYILSILGILIIISEVFQGYFSKHEYAITYSVITFGLVVYLPIGYFSNRNIIKVLFNDEIIEYCYKNFKSILTLMYIVLFISLNISGFLYADGSKGKIANLINNCFLTMVTITQVSKNDIFLNNFKTRIETIRTFLKTFL